MSGTPLTFISYAELGGRPNVVLDGSPTEGTVLCLTHWPGFGQPAAHAEDLSAEMAFSYLGAYDLHGEASAVSNNHFDQDGLVSIFALSQPAEALARREILIDIAGAGDFAVYRSREAARISMVLGAYGDMARTPVAGAAEVENYDVLCPLLYADALARLAELCDHPARFRSQWEDEDATLSASEDAIRSGAVRIEEIADVDLAIVTVPEDAPDGGGHRFGGQWVAGLHPMAVHGATERGALLVQRGARSTFTYRYESWVQYRSRKIRARVDLAPLAAALSAEEPGHTTWAADGVSDLTPNVQPAGSGTTDLAPERIRAMVEDHLRRASPAWDPYRIA
jgi:hypothetical protein